MSRPTRLHLHRQAFLHNLRCVQRAAPGKKVVAVVKADAYGCGLSQVVPLLDGQVDAFAVACLEEAVYLRKLGSRSPCVLLQGVFNADELYVLERFELQCVVHQQRQLQWILAHPFKQKIKVWIKIDTGMHRLGFAPQEVDEVIRALQANPWVDDALTLMTHLASSDEPHLASNQKQLETFNQLSLKYPHLSHSLANSGAILALPSLHGDIVRAGIMLYGVSPFVEKTGHELGLKPVMQLESAVSAIHHFPAHEPIGYSGTWQSDKPSVIGLLPVGYGDGYPRHIEEGCLVWINGQHVPIVGRVSMDMLTIDLSHCRGVKEGDIVELWGQHIPIEQVARKAGTIAYELMCQLTHRVRDDFLNNNKGDSNE
jgi:alanine racemase